MTTVTATCRGAAAMAAALTIGTTLVIGFAGSATAGGRHGEWRSAKPLEQTDGTQVPGGCPIESPGGRFIFTARNPGTGIDIYANQRPAIGQPFEPGNSLPAPVNDPGLADDFCPTPLPDGGLYFVSRRGGGCGDADMYRTVQDPATGWSEPQNLGCYPDGPNTPGVEFSPSLVDTGWGTFLFFSTDYFTGNQDIYRSRMRSDGTFTKPVRLSWPVNTEYDDRQPNVSQDGRKIVFASDRPSFDGDSTGFDIFYAKRHSIFGRWRQAVNLSETVPFDTVDAGETRPSLSWDGERLVYGSGGVWISKRKR